MLLRACNSLAGIRGGILGGGGADADIQLQDLRQRPPRHQHRQKATVWRSWNYAYTGREYHDLFPSEGLVKDLHENKISPMAAKGRYYRETLSHLDPARVVEELGNDAILLCHEPPGEFCHRRAVAEWLQDALKIEVPERPTGIILPSQLCDSRFRFIKLGSSGEVLKQPFEKGWNIFDLVELEVYLKNKQNEWDNAKAAWKA
jgi:hypothetical protein